MRVCVRVCVSGRYNLAGLAKRQGKHSSAEACYAEALDIFRAKLGDSEGETADTMYQMGCLYRKKCVVPTLCLVVTLFVYVYVYVAVFLCGLCM